MSWEMNWRKNSQNEKFEVRLHYKQLSSENWPCTGYWTTSLKNHTLRTIWLHACADCRTWEGGRLRVPAASCKKEGCSSHCLLTSPIPNSKGCLFFCTFFSFWNVLILLLLVFFCFPFSFSFLLSFVLFTEEGCNVVVKCNYKSRKSRTLQLANNNY